MVTTILFDDLKAVDPDVALVPLEAQVAVGSILHLCFDELHQCSTADEYRSELSRFLMEIRPAIPESIVSHVTTVLDRYNDALFRYQQRFSTEQEALGPLNFLVRTPDP